MRSPARAPRPETPWTQQCIPAWQPLLTPRHIIIIFVVLGVVFLPIGVGLTISSNNVKEYTARYDDVCGDTQWNATNTCSVSITITEDLSPPIMVYYRLTNFHQNQRLYVKSRSGGPAAARRTRGHVRGSRAPCAPLCSRRPAGGTRGSGPQFLQGVHQRQERQDPVPLRPHRALNVQRLPTPRGARPQAPDNADAQTRSPLTTAPMATAPLRPL
jgi:hypothetical protein